MKFSIVFLANTISAEIYKMNLNALNTFVISAVKANLDFEIIFVESNTKSEFKYSIKNFIEIKPDLEFNFHKFANIGLKNCTGDFYILSNNDVVFNESWLVELMKIIHNQPKLLSFSPLDVLSNKLPKTQIAKQDYVLGYDIQKHITGWCLVMHNSVYKKIKKLDERFNFYYADNDYAMQLIKHNIKHALVTKSYVEHLEGKSAVKSERKTFVLPEKTPQYIIRENWNWILSNEKMINGLILFHEKYGSRKLIKLKFKIVQVIDKLNVGYLKKYII